MTIKSALVFFTTNYMCKPMCICKFEFKAQAVYIDTRFFIVCYRMYFRNYENIKLHTITMAISLYKPYLHLQAHRIYLKVHGKLLESQLI